MAKPTVYIETSIIGYLAMRMSRDLLTAAKQQVTHDWWDKHRGMYELLISQYVVEECLHGDPTAAQERQAYLLGLPVVELSSKVKALADALLADVPLPRKATVDAFHISVAAVNGIEYLLTWNCKHIANPALRPRIERICRELGYEPPAICTPQELLEINDVP
jgi:hypothetical protein